MSQFFSVLRWWAQAAGRSRDQSLCSLKETPCGSSIQLVTSLVSPLRPRKWMKHTALNKNGFVLIDMGILTGLGMQMSGCTSASAGAEWEGRWGGWGGWGAMGSWGAALGSTCVSPGKPQWMNERLNGWLGNDGQPAAAAAAAVR